VRRIWGLPDGELKPRLMDRTRLAVVDGSPVQLHAGRARTRAMAEEPGFAGIDGRVFFFRHNIGEPLNRSLSRIFRERDPGCPERPVYLGMTSCTLGALDADARVDGRHLVRAVAEEMHRLCYRVYAVDFSSPMWRMQDFLRDTGRAGVQYLRLTHGQTTPEDEAQPLPALVRPHLRFRYGRTIRTVGDYLRAVALGPGLAAHYVSVWPGVLGHCAGYSVLPDGSLARPHILDFAEHLAELCADVRYRSQVFLFLAIELAACNDGRRTWFIAPGSVLDFALAQNDANGPR